MSNPVSPDTGGFVDVRPVPGTADFGDTEPRAPGAFLELRDLKVHFPTDDGVVKSSDGVSFSL
jgi:hypothetical protein